MVLVAIGNDECSFLTPLKENVTCLKRLILLSSLHVRLKNGIPFKRNRIKCTNKLLQAAEYIGDEVYQRLRQASGNNFVYYNGQFIHVTNPCTTMQSKDQVL